MSFPPIHRVVTGHDADGKAIVASNGPLSTIRELESIPGMIFHEVWETRGTPAPVDNGPDPTDGPTVASGAEARHHHSLRRLSARLELPRRGRGAHEGVVQGGQ